MFRTWFARALMGPAILSAYALLPTGTRAEQDTGVSSPVLDILSRVYGSAHVDDSNKWTASIETIQPIALSSHDAVFVQGRAAHRDDDWTFNAGVGYRHLLPSETWIFGGSVWWDGTREYDHRRWGLGFEAVGQVLTVRANYYDAYSDWKIVSISPNRLTRVEERALDGFDTELEGQVPFIPWARLGLGYYQWDTFSPGIENVRGFRGRLELDLTDFTRLETGIEADNYDTTGYGRLTVALGAAREVEFSAARTGLVSHEALSKRDLKRQLLARVKRNHTVVVERRTVSQGVGGQASFRGVTIGRGS